jgi:phosphinothricin acetyltransferase
MTDPRLRVATPDDGAAAAAIFRPYVEDTAIAFEETPPTAAAMTDRIEKTLETYPWIVAEEDGEIVGYAYASRLRDRAAYRWTAELSVYVDRDRRCAGLGSTLYETLLATLDRQGFQSAFAAVTVPNPESVGFHEALGFEHVGTLPDVGHKLGEWHDVAWFERGLGGREADPAPPTPFAERRATVSEEAVLAAPEDADVRGL